tara:strand:- start:476 stop:1243 length:768 start_codon:yes stop_codon:yes gene_type:complete
MIIWIASYPKSGNTLLRGILGTYFFSDTGQFDFKYIYRIGQFPTLDNFKNFGIENSDDKYFFKSYNLVQKRINQEDKRIKFYKTHSAFFEKKDFSFSNKENTLGAIYIIRDPRNVVTSYSHHYSLDIDEATNQICNKDLMLRETEVHPATYISSWQLNYLSWTSLGEKVLFIKYEDLINNKKKTLLKIFKFFETLGMRHKSFDIAKLNKVIKTTEFEKMKNLENQNQFREAAIDQKTKKKNLFLIWVLKIDGNIF